MTQIKKKAQNLSRVQVTVLNKKTTLEIQKTWGIEMEMNTILIGVNSFDFPDKATGAVIQGCRVRCLSRVASERRGSAVGFEMVEFRAPFGIHKALLNDAEHVLGDEECVPCTLIGEFKNVGKTMTFEVHGIKELDSNN